MADDANYSHSYGKTPVFAKQKSASSKRKKRKAKVVPSPHRPLSAVFGGR